MPGPLELVHSSEVTEPPLRYVALHVSKFPWQRKYIVSRCLRTRLPSRREGPPAGGRSAQHRSKEKSRRKYTKQKTVSTSEHLDLDKFCCWLFPPRAGRSPLKRSPLKIRKLYSNQIRFYQSKVGKPIFSPCYVFTDFLDFFRFFKIFQIFQIFPNFLDFF